MLYKKDKWIIILLFLTLAVVQAQEKTIHGLIVVDFKNEYPESVVVKNKQTHETVLTDIAGSFKIKASVGDTLYFSGYFLEDRRLPIKELHFNFNPLIVHMNAEVIKLQDIIVRPPLTGDLKKDIASVKKRDEVEQIYANLGIDIRTLDIDPKEKKEDVIPSLGGVPIPTSVNVEALLKSITGYYRKMGNLNQYEYLDNRLVAVRDYFGEDYFEQILGIETNDIREFLLYVYGVEKAVYDLSYKQKDFLSLDQLMRNHATIFKQRIKERNNANKN